MAKTWSITDPYLLGCALAYAGASLAHFVHNGLYVADYPNLPQFITPAIVAASWLAVTSIGVLAYAAMRWGARTLGLCLLACYAAFGFDAFAHYGLAPLSEHTFAMNLTIWSEAGAAAVLFGLALTRVIQRRIETTAHR